MKDTKKQPTTINCFQACNHFCIVEANRRITMKVHADKELTVEEWGEQLRKDKLL